MNDNVADITTSPSCCASCGKAANNDVKLKKCTACHLVRYCSVKCQKVHRKQHKRECKKRAAELHDELLFKQTNCTYLGDCPICCLPMPLDPEKYGVWGCCGVTICNGCNYDNQKREVEARQERKCPFCRHPIPKSQAESDMNILKRAEANDPVALKEAGSKRFEEGDNKGALEYWTKAAELGDLEAHYQLSCSYKIGAGVEKDEGKYIHHLEQAAIGGHLPARHNLGSFEGGNGNFKRAVKHWIIAANQGYDNSLATLKKFYGRGIVSKDDFAAALRAHQAAVDATKSPQREEAKATLDVDASLAR